MKIIDEYWEEVFEFIKNNNLDNFQLSQFSENGNWTYMDYKSHYWYIEVYNKNNKLIKREDSRGNKFEKK